MLHYQHQPSPPQPTPLLYSQTPAPGGAVQNAPQWGPATYNSVPQNCVSHSAPDHYICDCLIIIKSLNFHFSLSPSFTLPHIFSLTLPHFLRLKPVSYIYISLASPKYWTSTWANISTVLMTLDLFLGSFAQPSEVDSPRLVQNPFFFSPAQGGILPLPIAWVVLVGFPMAASGTPWLIRHIPMDQGVPGCCNHGNLPSHGTPGLLLGALSHQIILGGCLNVGNASPGLPLLQVPGQVVPPLIFCIFMDISLYKCYFIGGLKKVCKNVGNKLYKKYHPIWNVNQVQSHQRPWQTVLNLSLVASRITQFCSHVIWSI